MFVADICKRIAFSRRIIYLAAWMNSTFFFFSVLPCDMRGLTSSTRDRNHPSCIGRWSLNHWTPAEVPFRNFLNWLWNQSLCLGRWCWENSVRFKFWQGHWWDLNSWENHPIFLSFFIHFTCVESCPKAIEAEPRTKATSEADWTPL